FDHKRNLAYSVTFLLFQWNLICDNAHKGAAVQSCFFAGMLIGSLVGGWASDRFGRRLCLLLGSAIMTILSFGTKQFSSEFVITLDRRIMNHTLFFYSNTSLPNSSRTFSLFHLFACLQGLSQGPLLAFFLTRCEAVSSSDSGLERVVFLLVFPDTACWLIAQGRQDKARELLMKYGGKKKKPLDSDNVTAMIESIYNEEMREQEKRKNGKNYTALDLFRSPKLRKRTLILCFNWFVISLISFGIYLYITALAGNLYVNYLVMTLLSVPHLPISWFLMQRFGRRIPFFGYMFIAGILCLVIMGIPKGNAAIVAGLAIFGRSLTACAFNNIYLISSEQFPTVVRNIGMGVGSMCARVGAILSPFIVMLVSLDRRIESDIFGVLAVLAAISSLWLPETLNTSLPQTIEEMEK
ncbi:predicted protein, partial [Nematostella vectensis]